MIKFLCSGASAVKILKKSKERNYKVAVLGNKIVGVICLTENENRIRQFFVDPLHQGKGVGRELINFIEKEAKKLKLKYLQVHSSLFAVLFYKHFGYKKIRKLIIHKNNGPKFETILMKKAL
ncbi:MAG: GNAT family N-acetyltransferase [Patescibacteria group bacterium]